MANFIDITSEKNVISIKRNGIKITIKGSFS